MDPLFAIERKIERDDAAPARPDERTAVIDKLCRPYWDAKRKEAQKWADYNEAVICLAKNDFEGAAGWLEPLCEGDMAEDPHALWRMAQISIWRMERDEAAGWPPPKAAEGPAKKERKSRFKHAGAKLKGLRMFGRPKTPGSGSESDARPGTAGSGDERPGTAGSGARPGTAGSNDERPDTAGSGSDGASSSKRRASNALRSVRAFRRPSLGGRSSRTSRPSTADDEAAAPSAGRRGNFTFPSRCASERVPERPVETLEAGLAERTRPRTIREAAAAPPTHGDARPVGRRAGRGPGPRLWTATPRRRRRRRRPRRRCPSGTSSSACARRRKPEASSRSSWRRRAPSTTRPCGDLARWSWLCYGLQEDGTSSPPRQKPPRHSQVPGTAQGGGAQDDRVVPRPRARGHRQARGLRRLPAVLARRAATERNSNGF